MKSKTSLRGRLAGGHRVQYTFRNMTTSPARSSHTFYEARASGAPCTRGENMRFEASGEEQVLRRQAADVIGAY